MATVNCLVSNILQNIFFCVQQNKEAHAGLERQENESVITDFHFGVNCPFKSNLRV